MFNDNNNNNNDNNKTRFMLMSLRAGTPQCDEEQQQICAKLRNIYYIPIFRPVKDQFLSHMKFHLRLDEIC